MRCRHAGGWLGGWAGKQAGGRASGWAGGQMDRWAGGRTVGDSHFIPGMRRPYYHENSSVWPPLYYLYYLR